MKIVRLFEYGRLRPEIPEPLLMRLKAFDTSFARQKGNRFIFDWNTNKATSYVGVIQIPGLTVEILPKIDKVGANGDSEKTLAQKNLLYMLSFTRGIPIEERDLAGLKPEKSFFETLIAIFTRRLLDELRKGLDHAYIHHEENLSVLKGKLLFSQHIRSNVAHRERVFVGYDEFVADTPLNRVFKATCRCLLGMVWSASVQKPLRESLAVLDEVRDCTIVLHDFEKIHLTRNNERFRVLLDFCRMVLLGQNPAPAAGKERTFALLFPMEQLFEEFIAAFLYRHVSCSDLDRSCIHVQARGKRKFLLKKGNTRYFQLKPDIVIDGVNDRPPRLILDTKWKCLKTSEEDRKNNVSQADIYQLYAYSTRYGCSENVLLYPRAENVQQSTYTLMSDEYTKIRIEQVDLSRDMRQKQNKNDLIAELRNIIKPGATQGDA